MAAKSTGPAKSSPGYNLSSSPSHLLHRAQQYAAERFSSAFGGDPITQRQFAVLVGVASAKDGLTQTDLVKLTGIDRSTLAELVARMTAKGLLKRARAKNDARANIVTLTPKGRALYTKALPIVRKADQAILAIIAKTKQPAFLSILKGIADALDAQAETAAPPKPPARATKTKTRASTAKSKSTAKAKTAKTTTRRKATTTRRKTTSRRK